MAEYIDKKVIVDNAVSRFGCVPILDDGTEKSSIHIDDFLNQLPTADVAPVRHAKWIKSHSMTRKNGAFILLDEPDCYRCSTCGREVTEEELYCHCGAKMDLED